MSIQADCSLDVDLFKSRGKRKFHIVFLIDASLSKCDNCSHCDEIVLITHRILSAVKDSSLQIKDKERSRSTAVQYHSSEKDVDLDLKANDSPDIFFKWGYKLFSSVETLPRSKNDYASFQNLNLAQLNKFETKLCNAFKSRLNDNILDNKNSAKRRSLSHPSQLFGTALTETLHDFCWRDDGVFSSPGPGRKHSFSKEYLNAWSNMVFLLSKAPITEKEMRQFSNKKVVDSEVFIDSFMTPALLREYQENFNITINWIDMSSESCVQLQELQTAYTQKCRLILHETCFKLGGKFLSKKCIIGGYPVDKAYKEPGRKIVEPDSAAWIPAESHTLDILSETTGCHHEPKHEVPYSATISILCFGLKNIPVHLVPLTNTALSSRKTHFMRALPSDKISGASLSLYGLVQGNNVFDELIQHSLQSFILKTEGCESVTHFFQTLETSNTIGLVNVIFKNDMSRQIAVIQSHLSILSLTFLDGSFDNCQQLAPIVTNIEESERSSCHLETVSESETLKNNVLERLHHSIKKLNKGQKQECIKATKGCKSYQVYQSHCLNSWHLPGSTNQMSAITATLLERVNDKGILKKEKDGLKKLKQFYAKERQPKELIHDDQPVLNTPLCATKRSTQRPSKGSEESLKVIIKKSTSSILQRGRLMVDKARSVNTVSTEDYSNSPLFNVSSKAPETRSSNSIGFNELGLKSESDLRTHLKNQYEQILEANVVTEVAVKAMVTVTSQFMTRKDFSDPQKATACFIQEHVVLKPAELKAKYQTKLDSTESVTRKSVECKLQVLLMMEAESLLKNNTFHSETLIDKIVDILRVLSFSSGAMDLKLFLKDIVNSYSATLPKLLVNIYDELMLPLPSTLKKIASPAGPSSVLTRSFEHDTSLSSAPNSSQPSSILSDSSSQQMKRSSRLKQHPSLADYRQKKQILMEPVLKPQKKNKAGHSNKEKTTISEKEKSKTRSCSPQKKYGGECDKAKRNLFSEHRPKVKSSKLRERHSKSRRKRRHSLSTSDKARTLVLSTPLHKQKSGWHIQQQERRRSRDKVESDVSTVAESPLKESDPEHKTKTEKPARYLVRQAFYSSKSQQSRNFAKAVSLSQNADGFPISEISYEKYPSTSKRTHGTLASAVHGESPLLSPRSRLIKTLMPSPSPAPKLQRKTSQMSTPARPSKRLVKKLDFSNADSSTTSKPRQHVLDAQLIFEGENAIDFDIMKSPSKRSTTNSFRECLKTPEKQIKPSRPDMWSSASCPPPSSSTADKASIGSSSELDFRNSFLQNAQGNEYGTENSQNKSPHALRKNVRKTPNKPSPLMSPNSPSLTSPGQASMIRSNLFSRSPKKVPLFSNVSEKQCCVESDSGNSRSPRRMQTRLESKTIREREGEFSKDNIIFDMSSNMEPSTPKKAPSCVNNASQVIQSTPSKVKFLDEYLISPPTGSGYPPSAEKSTPGKSILKGSPSMKNVKIPRRIQLQLVENKPIKMGKELELNLKENHVQPMKSRDTDNKDILKNSALAISPCKSKKESNQTLNQSRLDNVGPNDTPKKFHLNDAVNLNIESLEEDKKQFLTAQSNSVEIQRNRPAAIQIRTPSPSAKKSSSIQSWARRKKCSPKQNSKSPSASILSPTSSSSSNDEKSRAQLSNIMTKENEITRVDSIVIKGKVKRVTRKRGLFQSDENEDERIQSKRLKITSGQSNEYHSSPFKSHDIDVECKGDARACSPELFGGEADNRPISNSSTGFSQSSWSPLSHHKKSSVSDRFSPLKRLTRQSSNLSGDGSLGFSNQILANTLYSNTSCDETSGHSELVKETSSASKSNCTPRKRESIASSSKSPGKKHYSPALSTFGLASLIRSPFVAPQSVSPGSDETKQKFEHMKPKSRKQLDLS